MHRPAIFTFGKDVAEVHVHVGNGGLKQGCHVGLGQPRGFIFQPDINFHLSVFHLINKELALGWEIGLFGGAHSW